MKSTLTFISLSIITALWIYAASIPAPYSGQALPSACRCKNGCVRCLKRCTHDDEDPGHCYCNQRMGEAE